MRPRQGLPGPASAVLNGWNTREAGIPPASAVIYAVADGTQWKIWGFSRRRGPTLQGAPTKACDEPPVCRGSPPVEQRVAPTPSAVPPAGGWGYPAASAGVGVGRPGRAVGWTAPRRSQRRAPTHQLRAGPSSGSVTRPSGSDVERSAGTLQSPGRGPEQKGAPRRTRPTTIPTVDLCDRTRGSGGCR